MTAYRDDHEAQYQDRLREERERWERDAAEARRREENDRHYSQQLADWHRRH